MFNLKRMEKVMFIKCINVQFKANGKSNLYKS